MLSLIKPRAATDSSSRERLRLAKQALAQAKQAVIETQATFERMESIVRAADDAARTASSAAKKVTEARADWVRGGCPYSGTREFQALEEKAADAARAAERAAADSKAVSKELRRLQSELESKHVAVRGVVNEVTAAAAMVRVEEKAPLFERFVQEAHQFLATREEVMAELLGIERPWSLESKNSMDPAHEAVSYVEAVIDRAAIPSWSKHVDDRRNPQTYLDRLQAPTRARIEALRGERDS